MMADIILIIKMGRNILIIQIDRKQSILDPNSSSQKLMSEHRENQLPTEHPANPTYWNKYVLKLCGKRLRNTHPNNNSTTISQ